ncbi:MAG: DUF5317 family protein [Acidimicrobiales bacterium]
MPVLAGVILGWGRGGRLEGLERLRLRASGLVMAALGVQLVLHRLPEHWRVPLVLASYAAVGLWIARNLGGRPWFLRAGLALLAVGWALNLAAIVPNGGMPVSESALGAVGVAPGYDVADGHLSKHVSAHGGVVDAVLGDSIPVPPLGAVISLGDILLAGGIALTLSGAMTLGREREAAFAA